MGWFYTFVFVVLAIVFLVKQTQAQNLNRDWAEAAKRLKLRLKPGSVIKQPQLWGSYRGYAVEVRVVTRGSGSQTRHHTKYRLKYGRSLGLGLRLTPQDWTNTFSKLFGAEDILVGDEAFDGGVVIQGSDAVAIASFLAPARRFYIFRFLRGPGRGAITDTQLTRELSGRLSSHQAIQSHLRQMATLADELLAAGETPLAKALAAGRRGDLHQALEEVRQTQEEAESGDADRGLLEGGMLFTARRFDEAERVFKRLKAVTPEDEEIGAWHERARNAARVPPPPKPEPAERTTPPPLPSPVASDTVSSVTVSPDSISPPAPTPSPAAPDPDLGAVTVCEALFGQEVSSFAASAIFDQRFEALEVTWTGKLKRALSFDHDLVFGDVKGVKALFDVHVVKHSLYGDRQVQAVVALPVETQPLLQESIGETFTFRGRLVRCDPFMRNLFVGGASLVSPGPEPGLQ